METRLVELLAQYFPEAEHIEVVGLEPIPGGYSRARRSGSTPSCARAAPRRRIR